MTSSEKKTSGRLRREQKRATHKEETARIYKACEKRAEGCCECGCGFPFLAAPEWNAELDHFYGRGVVPQSVENCWLLLRVQHQDKTLNRPDRAHWDAKFAAHCAKYGYEFKPRLVKSWPAKAGGAP